MPKLQACYRPKGQIETGGVGRPTGRRGESDTGRGQETAGGHSATN